MRKEIDRLSALVSINNHLITVGLESRMISEQGLTDIETFGKDYRCGNVEWRFCNQKWFLND